MDLVGTLRKFAKQALGQGPRVIRLTGMESVAMALVEDSKIEAARAGRRFHGGCQIIANGIAPVAAIPTTTATLVLYNGAQAGGKSLCVHKIGFWLGSGTPAAGATLFGTVSTSTLATAVAANATGYGSASSSGSAVQAVPVARWGTAAALPTSPAASAWFQLLSTQQLAAANVGQGDQWVELDGGLVVPPGFAMGFAILSGAGTTPLYGISATWSELELDLE